MQTIRSFIALELAPEIQQELARIQDQLQQAAADVKWVKPEGIHLTLKFLGSISPELTQEINKVIVKLAQEHQTFSMGISGLGAFPTMEHPRVIWVGIKQGKENTIKLTHHLEQGLISLGFMRQKHGFKPHLTLGRVRSAKNRDQLKKLLQSTVVTPKIMPAEKLTLFKSVLTPQGAIYEPLHQIKLS